ncbi:MAG TPA: hypothetical protein VK934_11285 [Fimbriimonas sp.]|nr:hypothetical protein [Fimbriimonas sp.]
MDRGGKNLILGIAIGAVAVLLAVRIKQIRDEEDPDALMEKLTDQLNSIERNFASLKK